jgi:hypothetical protein
MEVQEMWRGKVLSTLNTPIDVGLIIVDIIILERREGHYLPRVGRQGASHHDCRTLTAFYINLEKLIAFGGIDVWVRRRVW